MRTAVRSARQRRLLRRRARRGAHARARRTAHGQSEEFKDGREAAAEFHFARMIYSDARGGGFGRFRGGGAAAAGGGRTGRTPRCISAKGSCGSRESTRAPASRSTCFDGRVFDYPWLYATQAGYWDLSDPEIAMLREYLLRGGFLVTDDFWDSGEWAVFQRGDGADVPRIPRSSRSPAATTRCCTCSTTWTSSPRSRARVILSYCRDASAGGSRGCRSRTGAESTTTRAGCWSPIELQPGRRRRVGARRRSVTIPEPMTALAYRFGINYIIYAMTH